MQTFLAGFCKSALSKIMIKIPVPGHGPLACRMGRYCPVFFMYYYNANHAGLQGTEKSEFVSGFAQACFAILSFQNWSYVTWFVKLQICASNTEEFSRFPLKFPTSRNSNVNFPWTRYQVATKPPTAATNCNPVKNNRNSRHKPSPCYQPPKIVYQTFFSGSETIAPQRFQSLLFSVRGLIIANLTKKYVTFSIDCKNQNLSLQKI